ncbi:RDD family protein [Rheinheimera sp.]|uniref:RDD family protein n=1 Tax=Rheinheimera sp. TaxID=1869214 RepID=UPI00307E0BF2
MTSPDASHDITQVAPNTFVDETGHQLSQKEIRQIVTPHAFKVADSLIGQPLAKPVRRGMAIGIDGLLISALSSGSLVFILPLLGYLLWNRIRQQRIQQAVLVGIVTLTLAFTLDFSPQTPDSDGVKKLDLPSELALPMAGVALKLANDHCDYQCVEQEVADFRQQLNASGMSVEDKKLTLDELIDASQLSKQQQTQLQAAQAHYLTEPVIKNEQHGSKDDSKDAAAEPNLWQKLEKSNHSLLQWTKGILADFGVGFGWAMFYFTFFISWNQGQTIGKLLMGIQVVQLDDQPLSLWNSFSRQGGYGAGFATGLIGFLQILWDPNRQAIQDKVASTLVIVKRKTPHHNKTAAKVSES